MATLSPSELVRLKDACRENYKLAEDARRLRASYVRAFAGTDYPGVETDGLYDYSPKLRQSALAMVLSLAANRPRALVTTPNPALRAWARKRSRALDGYSKSLRLERVLQRCALAGFFGLGVAKAAMLELPATRLRAYGFAQVGRPGVIDPSTDHMSWDLEGADFDSVSFIGDRYKVRFADAINDNRFGASERAKLAALGPESIGRATGQDWAEQIARPTFNESSRFEDWIYLADVYVPGAQCIYTFGCDSFFELTTDPLDHVDWEGKPTGPYSFFSVGYVPGNTQPACPAQFLKRQHELINTGWRKINEGIEQLKTVFLAQTGDEGDAMRIRSAKHNGIVPVNNPQALQREELGGPSQQLMGALYKLEDEYDQSSNNLKHRLGLASSADTLGQEEIISQQSGGVTAYEQGLFADFVREIYQELMGLLERDVTTRVPGALEIPGYPVPQPDDWMPASIAAARGGTIEDFDVDIEPYDLPYKNPSRQAEELRQLWNEQLPQWELMSQGGVQPDVAAYLDAQARLRSNTFIRELFKFQQPIPPVDAARPPARGGAGANKPGGNYTHRSVSGNKSDQRGEIMAMMAAGESDNNGRAA